MHIQGYINLSIIVVAIVSILYIPILFILKRMGKGAIRQLSYLALLFSVLLTVFVTIILFNLPITFSQEQHFLNLVPFNRFVEGANTVKTIAAEIIPNIMIFIPLGIFIPVVFKKARKLYKTAVIIFLITFSIEFFQYFIGRLSDVDDIITNLLGGITGYGIFKVFDYLFKDKKIWNKFIGKDY